MSDKRLEKSVEATINHRFGKVFSAIFELKAVIEDLRFQMIGGLKCGIDIWEVAMILSLLNNSGTWVQTSQQAIDELNKLKNMFLQTLFAVGQSCPKPALSWDTAMLHMDVRIDKSKLALIHHFKNLDNTSLAKRIYEKK